MNTFFAKIDAGYYDLPIFLVAVAIVLLAVWLQLAERGWKLSLFGAGKKRKPKILARVWIIPITADSGQSDAASSTLPSGKATQAS